MILKGGRERSVLQGHPWLFSGSIERVLGDPAPGTTVSVAEAGGGWIAHAAWSPVSQIRARIWSRDARLPIDPAFFRARIVHAAGLRAPLFDGDHGGARLVHGEADGLPGIIVDRYGSVAVVQLLSAGADHWRAAIVEAIATLPGIGCVIERSDAEVRALEGLPERTGVVAGTLPAEVTFREDDLDYIVDPVGGQKTGFYLDQRDNRRLVRDLAAGRRVLNAFCYSGGFTLAALAGGATSVVSIDSSGEALALGVRNFARNQALAAAANTWIEADVFAHLRQLRNEAATFDLIVLDPPKFAPTAAHAEGAGRAYKDINLLALKLLVPGGMLATFSCSGGVDADLFQKIVAGAAVDAGAGAQILRRLGPSADHPVALSFPEGDYLKGLLLRKT
ncbi:MAG: class I SAM-dependent rRNA methyltransferase [Casimicrobiaceae bacterium]